MTLYTINRLAKDKGCQAKWAEGNEGLYVRVWVKRRPLKNLNGAEVLTVEEAYELLNLMPDINELELQKPEEKLLKLIKFGHSKKVSVVTHREGGIQIEDYSGKKLQNPATGEFTFTYREALEWLLRRQ